jgi:hypothetical protein
VARKGGGGRSNLNAPEGAGSMVKDDGAIRLPHLQEETTITVALKSEATDSGVSNSQSFPGGEATKARQLAAVFASINLPTITSKCRSSWRCRLRT